MSFGPRRLRALLLLAVGPALVACTSVSAPSGPTSPGASITATSAAPTASSVAPSTSPTPSAPASADAVVTPVGDAQWARIVAAGMARRGCPLTQGDVRRVEVNHWDFAGSVQRGVLVVNADVADSVARIFTRLFDERYPIRRMRPLELYGGDNEKSMADDNTAAFNCRNAAQANAPALRSPHANGRAVDVNPRENPWKDPRCTCWSPSARYGDSRVGVGVITEGGPTWTAFTDEGWIWQDISVKDYMHFDTGYPSTPRPLPSP
jgi:hypothetical protein